MRTEAKTFRLFQLCESIRRALEQATGGRKFWVSCEISGISERRGHRYLELVDVENDEPIARMQATLWQGMYNLLRTEYGSDFDALLETGKKVMFQCSVEYHEFYGLKLLIHDADLTYTLGDLELRKTQTLEQLRKEGLLRRNAGIPLNRVIKKILIISSPSAAGLEDFVKHLENNSFGYVFSSLLVETPVQGAAAEGPLIQAVTEASNYNADAVVIIRGGGSRLDLEVFNSYGLGKAIAQCTLPVFTGIGHETDETVADACAFMRCKTPTAVAHFIIEYNASFHATILQTFERIGNEAQMMVQRKYRLLHSSMQLFKRLSIERVLGERNKLDRSRSAIGSLPLRNLERSHQRIKLSREGLVRHSLTLLLGSRAWLSGRKEVVSGSGYRLLRNSSRELSKCRESLHSLTVRNLEQQRRRLDDMASRVNLVHPVNILRKGFAIVELEGRLITRADQVKEGEKINTHFHTFSLESEILTITEKTDGKTTH